MGYFEKKLSGNVVYNGIIVSVRMDKAEVASGHIVNREIVDHPGGVAVLPVDGEGNAYLVRQFRYPFMKEMLEVPAGKLERLQTLDSDTGVFSELFFIASLEKRVSAARRGMRHLSVAVVDVVTDPNALSIPPEITWDMLVGFTRASTRSVFGGGVGKMIGLARANLRNIGAAATVETT